MENLDELLKMKELMDEGIITKEEFEKKKNELLNTNTSINNSTDNSYNTEVCFNNPKANLESNWTSFWLCLFLGMFGAHKFCQKKTKMGILYLFTFGLFGIGPLVDLIKIIFSSENNKMSKLTILLFIFIFGFIASNNKQPNLILDATSFYNVDKSNTITQEELKYMKGEPINVDIWDYEINSKTSYKITTLKYLDGEYHFYNNHLAWILIEKEIPYNNKNSILGMFGLEENINTIKAADTGYALRYENCGVPEFWITGIENKTFNWTKIVYSEIFK